MTLEDEISQAQVFITEPPKNGSNTCEWIILPILWSTGYARRDIESRMADSTGQYPDYTLLPNHATATYYLEAKAWNVTLEDMHVKQALNYANHNGRRFVVLTNGQNWRLYDNAIQGQLAVKLLTEVRLRDTAEITDFLTALSKHASANYKKLMIYKCKSNVR
jgi:predicted type IV restriction endonuclease